jgi:hypothetical protein
VSWGDDMADSRDREIDRTITNNLQRLSEYGVLTARPGYEITDHQLTDEEEKADTKENDQTARKIATKRICHWNEEVG